LINNGNNNNILLLIRGVFLGILIIAYLFKDNANENVKPSNIIDNTLDEKLPVLHNYYVNFLVLEKAQVLLSLISYFLLSMYTLRYVYIYRFKLNIFQTTCLNSKKKKRRVK
jgi:hypothetical protein